MAESPGEGKGSTFKVILPERSVPREPGNGGQEQRPVITGKVPTNQEASLKGLKVLVVDDERDTRELISAVLTVGGAKVVSVTSAFEALRELARRRFDVLLSDIGMPEMDGYALIRKIRQRSARLGGRVPASALTAYAGTEDHERVHEAGYQIHTPKPIVPAELITAVASLGGHNMPLPIRVESRRTATGFSSRKAFT